MPSRAVEVFEIEELSFFAEPTAVSAPVRASLVCRVVDLAASGDLRGSESDASEGSCLVGAAWAVALEATAVLTISGIWNLLHLLH